MRKYIEFYIKGVIVLTLIFLAVSFAVAPVAIAFICGPFWIIPCIIACWPFAGVFALLALKV